MRKRNIGTEILDFSASLITTAVLGLALLASAYIARQDHAPNLRASHHQAQLAASVAWADRESR
jgi:hypothetical protein